MSQKPNLLLLSGYHAKSHRYWSEELINGLVQYQWTEATLPDRHFYWRIRSNALTFAFEQPQLQSKYELLLATSMVDLCNLRGLLPHLSSIPTLLYFHENQFAYPQRKANSNLINAQLTTIYSALVADKLLFNSEYNRDTFLNGAYDLLKKMPDGTPRNLIDALPVRTAVVPVPVRDELWISEKEHQVKKPLEILWNHRWEYDKQPQVFIAAMTQLLSTGYNVLFHVVGQSFREVPDCFAEFYAAHSDHILTWGYQTQDDYYQVLERADIVVSAALHDFQGLGMLEAIAAGCIPVAPGRMAYPEYIDPMYLYPVTESNVESCNVAVDELQEVKMLHGKLVEVIETLSQQRVAPTVVNPSDDTDRFRRSNVLPAYSSLIDSCLNRADG